MKSLKIADTGAINLTALDRASVDEHCVDK